MSNKKIERKDIITDEALNFGKEYAKNMNEAIRSNKKFLNQTKKMRLNEMKHNTLIEVPMLIRAVHDYKREIDRHVDNYEKISTRIYYLITVIGILILATILLLTIQ